MEALLARIKSRCVITAEGCWIWQGTYISFLPVLQSQTGWKPVSRLIACFLYHLKYEETGQAKQICFNPECVCPDHTLVPGREFRGTTYRKPIERKEEETKWNQTPAQRVKERQDKRIPLSERNKIRHLHDDLGMSVVKIGSLTRRPYAKIEAVLRESEGR